MKRKIVWVDAFTEEKFGGNPCAVIFNADSLSAPQMLQIAREMNLSETAFVVSSTRADFGARYFTPAEEIPLAGHPTLSLIHALLEVGEIKSTVSKVSLELKAGIIRVDILREAHGSPLLVMTQKKPEFLSIHDPKKISALFSLNVEDLLPGAVVQTVSTGTPQLMVPVKNHDVLRKATMDVAAYKAYKATSDFFNPHLFCLQGASPEGATFARDFGVPPDTLEDPFTGSATGGMAAYLWRYGLLPQPEFVAEQGHWLGRPGKAWVEVVGERSQIESVKVAGRAVTVFIGEMDF
jgi:trans-2,3-dihydro-3-hydroxyanthranilate isomerase